MNLVLVSPPVDEPVTLAEAKAQCRVTHTAEDDLIASFIVAARQHLEDYTKRSFITQTWRLTLREFPSGRIRLPRPPLIAVTEVAYTDGTGAAQMVTGPVTDVEDGFPVVLPAYGTDWPIARPYAGSVRITYTAGYGQYDDVPAPLKLATKMLVEHYFKVARGPVITGTIATELPHTIERLVSTYRVLGVP